MLPQCFKIMLKPFDDYSTYCMISLKNQKKKKDHPCHFLNETFYMWNLV